MNARLFLSTLLVIAAFALVMPTAPARADSITTHCDMSFSMSGWSAIYKISKGTGTVTCNNGQSMRVALKLEGAGFTAGKSTIDDGHADFTGVRDISDVLGGYAAADAHAGAGKTAAASVLTKGEVSLALGGTGRGIDLGVDISKFTITRLEPEPAR